MIFNGIAQGQGSSFSITFHIQAYSLLFRSREYIFVVLKQT